MSEYVVHFRKDRDFRRFNLSGIMARYSRGVASFDIYEETTPIITKFSFNGDEDSNIEYEDGDIINYLHATVVVNPKDLPTIIKNLQSLYDDYLEETSPPEPESGG